MLGCRMPDRDWREALRGAEVRMFDLSWTFLSSKEWAGWLKEHAVAKGNRDLEQQLDRAGAEIGDGRTQVDAMANSRNGRDALRGAEVAVFNLMFEVSTSEQWAYWLKALLGLAAAEGKRDLAQRLVRAGAEIGDALHKASRDGHGDIVTDLLESGVSIAARNIYDNTPLHIAALHGRTDVVQLLLLKGADVDVLNDRVQTPLFLAAWDDRLDTVLALLAAGADVGLQCQFGQSTHPVLHRAAQRGNIEILKALVEHGADVDAGGHDQRTALHAAAVSHQTEAIHVLVEAGANVEARDRAGRTPLHLAAVKRNRETLVSLLKHGAAVNALANFSATPLAIAAVRAGTQGTAEFVDALLRAGADETIAGEDGCKAADLIGRKTQEENRLAEDFERVRELLANAPADRAWRRRGYLVLCRAHPDRVQQSQVISGTQCTGDAWNTRSCATSARAGGVAGDESTGADWVAVVAKVLRLQEEGIFRTIVGYI